MQFRVPQFIEIEDKILGPLTWKQASYCLGAIGVLYLALRFTDSKVIGLIIAAPFLALFLSLAFVKINNQNFIEILEHAFNFYAKENLYTWKKVAESDAQVDNVVQKSPHEELIPKDNKRNLRELALDLDTKVDN